MTANIAPTMDALAEPLLQVIRQACDLYKKELRPILTGDCLVYRHTEQNSVLEATDWSVNEYAMPDGSSAFASILRLTASAGDHITVRFAGLCADKRYKVCFDRSQTHFEMDGCVLMQQGICLTLTHILDSELVVVKTAS